jgi:hypothetical protein
MGCEVDARSAAKTSVGCRHEQSIECLEVRKDAEVRCSYTLGATWRLNNEVPVTQTLSLIRPHCLSLIVSAPSLTAVEFSQ